MESSRISRQCNVGISNLCNHIFSSSLIAMQCVVVISMTPDDVTQEYVSSITLPYFLSYKMTNTKWLSTNHTALILHLPREKTGDA